MYEDSRLNQLPSEDSTVKSRRHHSQEKTKKVLTSCEPLLPRHHLHDGDQLGGGVDGCGGGASHASGVRTRPALLLPEPPVGPEPDPRGQAFYILLYKIKI